MADGSHAVSLLPLIDEVLTSAGCSVDALDAVAVSSGPGSFTGLRIGLSVAKGLACAGGIGVVAVHTLEALARTLPGHRGVICSLLDARKGEVYAACFEASPQGWRRLTADQLVTPEALVTTLQTPCVVLGDAVIEYGEFLRSRLQSRVTVLPFDTYGPRGGIVAGIGYERLASGQIHDIAALEPLYIRPSEAELKSPVSV
jgi:tRNA threonylcarbamoyladenosine biosynthesis protein TsaB